MSKTTYRLPHPDNSASYQSVWIATTFLSERFIAAMGSLAEAKAMAEAHDDAIPYFTEGMTWVEADPLPPLPGHRYGRRQWIGSVVTEPHAGPTQFRVVQQCIETLTMCIEDEIPRYDREKVRAEVEADKAAIAQAARDKTSGKG